MPGEISSFASSQTMVERPPILESGPSSGVKIGPSSFESWTVFPNTVVTLPSAPCRGRCACGPRSVSSLLDEQRPWHMACGEEEGLVEDYWIVIILCVRERRGDRFDRAGIVAVLEKFIRRLKMVLAKKEIEVC